MANWDLLNKNYEDVVNNISDAEWESWAKNREKKKELRRLSLKIKAKSLELILKLEGLIINSAYNIPIENATVIESDCSTVFFNNTNSNFECPTNNDEGDFPIAA